MAGGINEGCPFAGERQSKDGAGVATQEVGNMTYTFTIGVVESLQLHNVWVSYNSHDLKLTILEPLVLENSLDGSVFSRRGQLGLENNSERPITNNLALCVLQVLGFAGNPILHFLADHLCRSRVSDWLALKD
jgi:hypothetical protein